MKILYYSKKNEVIDSITLLGVLDCTSVSMQLGIAMPIAVHV